MKGAAMLRILKRDIGSQFRVSSNLGESVPTKIARLFWAVIFTFKGLRLGFAAMWSEQLGSRVIHQGRQCFVSNWAGSNLVTLAGEGFYREYVPREEIKNVVNAAELWHRFEFKFGWYMSSWHGIDVNRKLYN